MAKTSSKHGKTRKSQIERAKVHNQGNVVHTVFDDLDWHPLDTEIDNTRDKSYMRTIKPRSDGQRALMEAIKEKI